MGDARLNRESVEVVIQTSGAARLNRESVEAITQSSGQARLNRQSIEVVNVLTTSPTSSPWIGGDQELQGELWQRTGDVVASENVTVNAEPASATADAPTPSPSALTEPGSATAAATTPSVAIFPTPIQNAVDAFWMYENVGLSPQETTAVDGFWTYENVGLAPQVAANVDAYWLYENVGVTQDVETEWYGWGVPISSDNTLMDDWQWQYENVVVPAPPAPTITEVNYNVSWNYLIESGNVNRSTGSLAGFSSGQAGFGAQSNGQATYIANTFWDGTNGATAYIWIRKQIVNAASYEVYVRVDSHCDIYWNGTLIGSAASGNVSFGGNSEKGPFVVPAGLIVPGEQTLAIQAYNNDGFHSHVDARVLRS